MPIQKDEIKSNNILQKTQNNYKEYREYLLDWTENEGWWNKKPKTFEDYNTVDLALSGSNLGFEPGDVDEE